MLALKDDHAFNTAAGCIVGNTRASLLATSTRYAANILQGKGDIRTRMTGEGARGKNKHNSRNIALDSNRSPRWSSGYPRIQLLIAFVLEFDSHRGEILHLFAKMQKKRISY